MKLNTECLNKINLTSVGTGTL